MQIVFSDVARADLREILNYGRRYFTQAQAEQFVDEMISHIYRLQDYPDAAPLLDGRFGKGFRSSTFYQYQICYTVEQDRLIIDAILPKWRV